MEGEVKMLIDTSTSSMDAVIDILEVLKKYNLTLDELIIYAKKCRETMEKQK